MKNENKRLRRNKARDRGLRALEMGRRENVLPSRRVGPKKLQERAAPTTKLQENLRVLFPGHSLASTTLREAPLAFASVMCCLSVEHGGHDVDAQQLFGEESALWSFVVAQRDESRNGPLQRASVSNTVAVSIVVATHARSTSSSASPQRQQNTLTSLQCDSRRREVRRACRCRLFPQF